MRARASGSNVADGVWALAIFTFLLPFVLQLAEVVRKPDDAPESDDAPERTSWLVRASVSVLAVVCVAGGHLLNPI